MVMSKRSIGLVLLEGWMLAGCSVFGNPVGDETDTDEAKRANDPYHTDPQYLPTQVGGQYDAKVTDDGKPAPGLIGLLFGSGDKKEDNGGGVGGPGGTGVGVNSYLWRATLDTISFMPLASEDPFGGVVITDWHSPPETPNERFKVEIFILSRELRADGVRASIFRQKRDGGGQWIEAS